MSSSGSSMSVLEKVLVIVGPIVIAIGAGIIIKVLADKRRARKEVEKQRLEAALKVKSRQSLQRRRVRNGETISMYSMESGYSGYLSRPRTATESTPAPSSFHSRSSTQLGSPASLKIRAAMSASQSVTSLLQQPQGVPYSSPLSQNPIRSEDIGVARSVKSIPKPIKVVPYVADAVRVSVSSPGSPATITHFSRPRTPKTDSYYDCSPLSPAFPSSPPLEVPENPPQLTLPEDIKGPKPATLPHIKTQQIIVTERAVSESADSSPGILEPPPVAMLPPRVRGRGRSVFGGSVSERPMKRRSKVSEPESVINRARGESVAVPKPPRVLSAVGDFGAAIFQQIESALQETKSLTSSITSESDNGRGNSFYEDSSTSSRTNSQISLPHRDHDKALEAGKELYMPTSPNDDTVPLRRQEQLYLPPPPQSYLQQQAEQTYPYPKQQVLSHHNFYQHPSQSQAQQELPYMPFKPFPPERPRARRRTSKSRSTSRHRSSNNNSIHSIPRRSNDWDSSPYEGEDETSPTSPRSSISTSTSTSTSSSSRKRTNEPSLLRSNHNNHNNNHNNSYNPRPAFTMNLTYHDATAATYIIDDIPEEDELSRSRNGSAVGHVMNANANAIANANANANTNANAVPGTIKSVPMGSPVYVGGSDEIV